MQGNSANLLARAGGANTTTTTPAATGTEKPNGSSVNGSVGYPEEDETYESDAQGDQVYADGGALQPDTTLTPPSQPHTSAAMTPAILTGQGSSAAGKLTGK